MHRIRDLLALGGSHADDRTVFFALVRELGFGLGDPFLQFPSRIESVERCCRRRHLTVTTASGDTWILEPPHWTTREQLSRGTDVAARHPAVRAAGTGEPRIDPLHGEGILRPRGGRGPRLLPHARAIDRVLVAVRGSRALTIDLAGATAVWDLATGTLVEAWSADASPQGELVLSPDGSRLLSIEADAVRIRPLRGGGDERLVSYGGWQPASYAVDPDCTRIALAGHDRQLLLLDLASGRLAWRAPLPLARVVGWVPAGIACLVARQDHTDLALADSATGVLGTAWEVPGVAPAELRPFEGPRIVGPAVTLAAQLPGRPDLLLASTATIFRCSPGQSVARVLHLGDEPVVRFALRADGREAALLRAGPGVQLWSIPDDPGRPWALSGTLATDRLPSHDVAYSPDGSFLLYTQACHLRLASRTPPAGGKGG